MPGKSVRFWQQDGDMRSHNLPIQYADDPAESGAKWERHVMVALWISLVQMIVLALTLVFAEGKGSFASPGDRPLTSLPDGF